MKMRTTGKRLLSMLLVLVMVFGLAPQVRADGSLLTEIRVEITEPVIGQHPDFSVRVPADANYYASGSPAAFWKMCDEEYMMRSEDTFEPGTWYMLLAQMCPKNGYQIDMTFSNQTQLFVNGAPLDVEVSKNGFAGGHMQVAFKTPGQAPSRTRATVTFKVKGGTWDGTNAEDKTVTILMSDKKGMLTEAQVPKGMRPLEGYTEFGSWDATPVTTAGGITGDVTYTYNFIEKTAPISEVSITGFTKPALGEKPDFTLSVPEGAPYHIATPEELERETIYDKAGPAGNGIWWRSSEGNMKQEDTFRDVPNNAYFMEAVLIPNTGYVFAESVTLTIDGGVQLQMQSRQDHSLCVQTETFSVKDPNGPSWITEVPVTGFTVPAYGAAPDFELNVPEGAHYRFATTAELEALGYLYFDKAINGVNWKDAGTSMSAADTFAVKKDAYSMTAVLVPEEGWAFAQHPVITINGRADLLNSFNADSSMVCFWTNSFTVTKPDKTEATVTFRVKNGSWADETTEDKTVTVPLTGGMGTLAADSVPAAIAEGLVGAWDVEPNTQENGILEDVTYTYTFLTPITQVSLTGYTAPVNGAAPDFELSLPEGAPYHLASGEELNAAGYHDANMAVDGVWWYLGDPEMIQAYPMAQTEAFQLNENYQMHAVLIPNDGYVFAGNLTASINGETGLVQSADSYGQDLSVRTRVVAAHELKDTATVTFRVVNGLWFEDLNADIIISVPLKDGKGTLPVNEVPVNMVPFQSYINGAWDEKPNTDEGGITGDVTYTYSFVPDTEAIVTFRVVNGTWDGEDSSDKTVTVPFIKGVATLDPASVPVGMVPNAGFGYGNWDGDYTYNDYQVRDDTVYTYVFHPLESVEINSENFPDPSFLEYVQSLPGAEDNLFTPEEIAGITTILHCNYEDTPGTDMRGIEYFTSLTDLRCYNNSITELDLSGNPCLQVLICSDNNLSSLDLSHNPGLGELFVDNNQLTSLDLTHNPRLSFAKAENNQLIALDVSKNPLLQWGNFFDGNQRKVPDQLPVSELSGFDVSKVISVEGGSFDQGRVNFTGDRIRYQYDCGAQKVHTFELVRDREGPQPEKKKCTVTFKVVNGTWEDESTAEKCVTVSLTKGVGTLFDDWVPVGMKAADGYEGGAWDVTPNINEGGITGDVTYTYTFTQLPVQPGTAEYTVRHMQQKLDGTFEEVTADTETLSGNVGADTAAVAKTYEGFTAQQVPTSAIAADGSTVVEIQYTRNIHTLNWNFGDGHDMGQYTDGEVPFGTPIVAPKPTLMGYSFGGWEPAVAETMPDADVTYTAKWTVAELITEAAIIGLTEPAYGATPDFVMGVPEGAHYHIASQEERVAAGWSSEGSVNGICWEGPDGTLSQQDVYADAEYYMNLLLIPEEGYQFAEGAAITSITINGEDTQVGGFSSFGNWAYFPTKAFKVTKPDPDKPAPVTVDYTVKHMLEKLGTAGSYEQKEAELLTGVPGGDTKAAAKPYEGFTAQTVTQQKIAADGSTVVEIKYTRNIHTLTFDANGGKFEGSESAKVPFGAAIAAPKVTRDGFTFDGWEPVVAQTMPDKDVVYTAKWTADVHTHKLTKVEGCEPTPGSDGWKGYYECSCGKFFVDENGTKEIKNLREWKKGDGKIPALGYKFLEGMNSTWKQYSSKSLVFRANGDIDCFVSIEVDGKTVDRKNYSVESGSTIVKLKPGYLQNLKVGTHTLKVNFVDGECETQFKVAASPKPVSPQTGDNSQLLLWCLLSLTSICGLTGITLYRRKRNSAR